MACGKDNMFDLEQAILEWRRRMLAAGITAPTPLDELESHLREEIRRQSRSAVDARQAFESAVRKMGHAQALSAEFTKIGAIKDARQRKFCIVSIIIVWGLILIITACIFLFRDGFDWGQRISGLAAGGFSVLLGAAGACLHRFFPAIVDKKRLGMIELAICVPFVAVVAVFMNFILP